MNDNSIPTRYEEAEDSPGLLLWQVTNLWQRQIRRTLEPLELTHLQFVLLACTGWLNAEGRRTTQKAISDQSKVDVMLVSQGVRTMEGLGWMVRTADPDDSRAYLIRLTPTGGALLAQAMPVVEAYDEEFFAGLGAERSTVIKALTRLMQRNSEPAP